MGKTVKITQESFVQKQLAEMKGGLYSYQEYRDGKGLLVIRFYLNAGELAVDYYTGARNIDMEDSEVGSYEPGDLDAAWKVALKLANEMAKKHEFTGPVAAE